jgi:hypothetical protein
MTLTFSRLAVAAMCMALTLDIGPISAQDPVAPATSGAAAETAKRSIDRNGLGLSAEQGKLIHDAARNEKAQQAADLTIGAPVPESMMLVELPVEVKDKVGQVRDFKFARLRDDTIVLVDPTSRVVVDVIRD